METELVTKKLTQAQIDLLKKPLPPEAISEREDKDFLSSIKAIYVVERLNDVFGLGGWTYQIEVADKAEKMVLIKKTQKEIMKTMVVLKVSFVAPEYGIHLTHFGGNDNDDLGDAYKGAVTDALTKIGSYLYIGMDVYKGKEHQPSKQEKKDPWLERQEQKNREPGDEEQISPPSLPASNKSSGNGHAAFKLERYRSGGTWEVPASKSQFGMVKGLCKEHGIDAEAKVKELFSVAISEMTKGNASDLIDHLQGKVGVTVQ